MNSHIRIFLSLYASLRKSPHQPPHDVMMPRHNNSNIYYEQSKAGTE